MVMYYLIQFHIYQVDDYNRLLADVLVFDDLGNKLVPELYYVEGDKVCGDHMPI